MPIFEDYFKKSNTAAPTTPAPVAQAVQGPPALSMQAAEEAATTSYSPAKPSMMSRVQGFLSNPNSQAMLGGLAQTVMGRYQDSWQAQTGGAVKEDAIKKRYSEVVSQLLEGKDIKDLDTKILPPEMITKALDLQDRAVKGKNSEIRENIKLMKDLMEGDYNNEYKAAMTKALTFQLENSLTKSEQLQENQLNREAGLKETETSANASIKAATIHAGAAMAGVKVEQERLNKMYPGDPFAQAAAGNATDTINTIVKAMTDAGQEIDPNIATTIFKTAFDSNYQAMKTGKAPEASKEAPQKKDNWSLYK